MLNQACLRELALTSGEAVLDVGSGLGQFTRDIARAVGSDGHVIGVIETARDVITGPLGFNTEQFALALRAVRQWGRGSEAAIWYSLCWAEGVRG